MNIEKNPESVNRLFYELCWENPYSLLILETTNIKKQLNLQVFKFSLVLKKSHRRKFMKKYLVVLFLLFLFSLSTFANTKTLARQAISEDSIESKKAINDLRKMNKKGLEILFKVYRKEIADYAKTGKNSKEWKRISYALDNVSMQKDAYSSGLFWHTDLEKAKIEAKKQNKPILTLRLLGNLNEEYSCANSRFFPLYSLHKSRNRLYFRK